MNDKRSLVYQKTVERVYAEQLSRYKRVKDAEKAAKTRLHAITGAFMTTGALARARAAAMSGDIRGASLFHASVNERASYADALFDQVFALTGFSNGVLDIACGLNPLYLAARGVKGVLGLDIHMGCVSLINDCAGALNLDISARGFDIMTDELPETRGLALVMKLLPLLERQRAGAGMELLKNLRGPYALVTFPTRTLSGRNVGMEGHYAEWFESSPPPSHAVRERFTMGGELCYILERV